MEKKRFYHLMVFWTIFSLLALVGCGSPTQVATLSTGQATTQPSSLPPTAQSPSITKIDACVLLTKADAEQILGNPVKEPTHPVQGNETFSVDSCEYQMVGGTALDNATLIVTIPSNGNLTSAQTAFTTGKEQVQAAYNAAPSDVPGLGDTAYWVGGSGNNLSFLKGNINITLSVSTQKGDAPSQEILDLAKVVLGRLP